jgi:multidrug efflux pump subunit AcrB
MNTKKKFDSTTFFVILVSIGLILFGMYFLNQSFTKKTTSKVESSSSSKANSSSIKDTSSAASQSSQSAESQSLSSEKSSESSSTNKSSNTQSLSSSKNNSSLSKSEARIKVLESLGGGNYEVQIIESGLAKPIFWVKDKKLKINNSSTLKKDTEYRVSDITETSTSFNYDSILE